MNAYAHVLPQVRTSRWSGSDSQQVPVTVGIPITLTRPPSVTLLSLFGKRLRILVTAQGRAEAAPRPNSGWRNRDIAD